MEPDSVKTINDILTREFKKSDQLLRARILGNNSYGEPYEFELAPFKQYDMELILRPYDDFVAELKRISAEGFETEGIPDVTKDKYDDDLLILDVKTYGTLEHVLALKQETGRYALLKKSSDNPGSTLWCDAECGRIIRHGTEIYKFVQFGKNELNFLYHLDETGLYMLRPALGIDQKPELAKIKVAELKFTAPSD